MSDVRLTVSGDTSKLEGDIRRALRKGDHKLSLDTKNFSRPLGQITGELGEFGKSLEASNARVLAFGASAGAIYAVATAIRSSVEAAVNLEKQLAEINVILGTSQKQLLGFGNELFQIAKDTGQAFNEVAEGAKELARQGLGMAESLRRTSDALILSRLTGLAAAEAVNTLTAAINGYSSAALTSSQVTNKIIAVDQAFAVSGKDLADALKRVGSTAAAAGVSFDELLGVVTAAQQITARGGSVIGNSFKTIFTRLQRPRTIEALEALGIATKDASGAMLPLMQVMTNLAKEFDTLSQSQQSNIAQLVGGVFQINVLKAALSDLGREYSIFGRATSISASATNEANRRNAELNKTLAAQLNALVQNVTRVGAVIGKLGLEPALKKAVGLLNSFMDRIDISDSESIGAKIGSGVLSGLGNFLSGPGLLILGAGIYKLFGFLTSQAKDALKTILQANTALGKRKQSEQAIITVLQQDKDLVNAITAGTVTHAEAVEKVRRSIVAATVAQRELNAVAAAAVAGGVTVGRGGRAGRAAGYMPNFARDEFRSEEGMAQALGASSSVKAHKSKGTIGGRKFVMNNQEIEIPNFGRNGDSAVIPQYYKGFIPNFADVTVKSLSAQYPRVRRTLATNKKVEEDDIVNIPSMRVVELTRGPKESELDYEKRAIKEVKAIDSRRRMKYGGSAAVDGFMGKGGRTFVEVKGGSYSKDKVKEKFGRGLLENAGVRSNGQMGMFFGAFKEDKPNRTDRVNLNRPILVAATKGGSFKGGGLATGFIPNFARKPNPLTTALMGGTATAGPALQALMSDPQGAKRLAGVLKGGARGGASGLQVSPQVRGMIAEAFPNIGQRSAMRNAERAVASAERHSGPRLNVLGLNTLGNRSVSKPGIREFGFRDPRIRKNFESGFNRRYLMFARGLAGDMLKGIPNQRKMMKAFTSRPPDPAATGQVKGRVFESIVSGMVTGMPTRMKGNEAVDLGRGTRIRSEFASLFTGGASKIGTGMEIRLGGAGGITSADARDKLRRFRGRASGYLPNFAFLEQLGSAMAAEEAGIRMSGGSGKARFGTDPRVGPMVYSSFQGTPAQAINEHLRAGQKFSTLKDSGKALRAAGYIPNFGIGGKSVGGTMVSVSGAGSTAGSDPTKELKKQVKNAGMSTEKFSNMAMNASFALSFAGGAASELAKSMGGSDKLGQQINGLMSGLSMAATAAMLVPGPIGMAAAAIGVFAAGFSFASKRLAAKNEDLIKEAEISKAEFQQLNDGIGQYSNTVQQLRDALKASRPDPKAILALENKIVEISTSLPSAFQNLINSTNDAAAMQELLATALEQEAKRVQGMEAASSLQERTNESFGKMFNKGSVFGGAEGQLARRQTLDDMRKNMDFKKFSEDAGSGALEANISGMSTQDIINHFKDTYDMSEEMAIVFSDLASRGESGKDAMDGLIDSLVESGKQADKTAKKIRTISAREKARIAQLNAQQKALKTARLQQKLVNDYINLNTKLLIKFGDALIDSAKKIHFARAEMAIESASPFLTEEAQAQLDFQFSREQAKDAEIQANKEGTRQIGAAFLEGVSSILDSDNKDHSELLAAMAPFAEAGRMPAVLDMINDQLMGQGKIDRDLQMQLAAAAQGSLAEIIALTERNGIALEAEVKIAAAQYELARQQAQLERDLKAGGGLDKFLDPDSLGKDLGNLGKNIEAFTVASRRGDNQQRGRMLLGIVDFMQQSGRLGGLNPDDRNDAQTIQTIANAQGEALRMQFLGIERMLMQAFRQTGDNSLIPLIRIMRQNARDAYRIAHTQLVERLKSRKIPEETLQIMSELRELMDGQQKQINQATTDTATNTGELVKKFPDLQDAFDSVDQFFQDIKADWETSFRDINTMSGAISNIDGTLNTLPEDIATQLKPILLTTLGPLTTQTNIDNLTGNITQIQGTRDAILKEAKIAQFQARQRTTASQFGGGVAFANTLEDPGVLGNARGLEFTSGTNALIMTELGFLVKQMGMSVKDALNEVERRYGVDTALSTNPLSTGPGAVPVGLGQFFGVDALKIFPNLYEAANRGGMRTLVEDDDKFRSIAGKISNDFMTAFANAIKTSAGKAAFRRLGVIDAAGGVDVSKLQGISANDIVKALRQGGQLNDPLSRMRVGMSLTQDGFLKKALSSPKFLKAFEASFNQDKALNLMVQAGIISQAQLGQLRRLNAQIAMLVQQRSQQQNLLTAQGTLQTLQGLGVAGAGGSDIPIQQAGVNTGLIGSAFGGSPFTSQGGSRNLVFNAGSGPMAGRAFTGVPSGGTVSQTGTHAGNRPVISVLSGDGTMLGSVNLQEGGIVTRRMNATLGERGPEAVIPLDRAVRGVNQTPQIESEQRSNDAYQLDVERNQILVQMGQAIMELRAVAQSAAAANNQLLMNIAQGQIGTRNAIVAAAMQNQAIMGQMNLLGQVAGNAQVQAGQAQQQAGATANAVGAIANNTPAPVRNGVSSAINNGNTQFAASVAGMMNFRYPGIGASMVNQSF